MRFMAGNNYKRGTEGKIIGLLLLPALFFGGLMLVPDVDASMQMIIDECAHPAPFTELREYCCNRPEPADWCVSSPSPSPSPEPEVRDPVLLVPGLAASHNSKLILKDRAGGEWGFAPTIEKTWRPLIERLEEEGYVLGEDLLVVFYDWRKSNTESAAGYLAPMVKYALEANEAEEVDIIAHSMGGLVARAYAQSDNLYEKYGAVDQLIMVGTPNKGAAAAYIPWEGGDFPKSWGYLSKHWIRRIERSLKDMHNKDNLEPPVSFRTFFPSLQDLLPTNDYVWRNGVRLPMSSMATKNDFLEELNEGEGKLIERGIRVSTIAGQNMKTLQNIPVGSERSVKDRELNRWRDGHPKPEPIQTDQIDGDQTVLRESVHAIGNDRITISGAEHLELPAIAQDSVLDKLVSAPVSRHLAYSMPDSVVGVDVLSPVMPVIKGPSGQMLSRNKNTFGDAYFDWDPQDKQGPKMLTIADPPPGKYEVVLTGNGSGPFTVTTSYTDVEESIFSEWKANALLNEEYKYTFEVKDGDNSKLTVGLPDEPRDDPGNGSGGDPGDQGPGGDCCPGPDPILGKVDNDTNNIGRVLGVIKRKGGSLAPWINCLHRQAYGRTPTYSEHIYWWDRVLKKQFASAPQLFGAMQWHNLHGVAH